MRPYIAIVVDSFREALSSRVLWLLLGIITLILLALAPLGVSFPMRTLMSPGDIRDAQKFARTLKRAGEDDGTIRRLIWDKLEEPLQASILEIADSDERDRRDEIRLSRRLAEAFNEIIKSEEAFDAEALELASLRKEGRDLKDREERNTIETQRLNRLVLDSAFRSDLRPVEARAVQVHYLGFDVMDPIPADEKMMRDFVKMSLAVLTNLIAATFGVLIAILVTASIIPSMFDVGSVNLLFSKPLVRSLMYLSKYVGGLSFVLINAAYLVVGVWLIVGIRFGVWHHRLILVIPILLFLFAIYYSVSAFAGMVWRNTIIAIAAAILLWGICFVVGLTYESMDALGNQPRRVVRAVATEGSIVTVAENGDIRAWSEENQDWVPAMTEDATGGPPAFARRNSMLGPIYDSENNRIIAIDRGFSSSDLLSAYPDRDWARESVDNAPGGCIQLMKEPSGEILVVDRSGISRILATEGKKNLPIKIFGFNYSVGPKRRSFESVGPRDYDFTNRTEVASLNPDDGSIVLYGDGELHRLTRTGPDATFELAAEKKVRETQDDAIVATAGDFIAIVDESATIHVLNKESLEETQTIATYRNTIPRFVGASKGGRFLVVVCHNRKAFAYDLEKNRNISRRISGQGDITAASFSAANTLLVADRVDRIREIDLSEGNVVQQFSPQLNLFDKIFHWGVKPINDLLPNPSKLKETSAYLLTEKDSIATTEDNSLEGARAKLDPWPPVYKGAAFTMFMLGLACVYIHWREF